MTTRAALEQIARGTPVGIGSEAVCATCDTTLYEGHPATVYLYRQSDESVFSAGRFYGASCAPSEIEHSTAGVEELLVEADLGVVSDAARQTHHLILLRPTVVDHHTTAATEWGALRQ